MSENEWFPEFVLEYLSFEGKCFRHCNRPTSMKVISRDSNRLVGAYVCPEGVVSQIVYFDAKPEIGWFQATLENQIGRENVNPADIRIASRHGWELGGKAQVTLEQKLGRDASIKEVYWTRWGGPKTEPQKLQVVSLCLGDDREGGCMKLFLHDRGTDERLCPACRAKYRGHYGS